MIKEGADLVVARPGAALREIDVQIVADEVARMVQEANYDLNQDVIDSLHKGLAGEESPAGQEILRQIIQNAEIAHGERVPICQDTGFAVIFMEIGQDVHFVGGSLEEAINAGVARGYTEGYLRKSILKDPLKGGNTGDNTPAIVHYDIVPGDKVKMKILPKGGGSENMSAVGMLKPADGVEGVKRFVLDRVAQAGPNPCPPIIVGVGIGGTFDKVAYLAKKAITRPVGQYHSDPDIRALEEELLSKVNNLGIGPQGLGGRTTALWLAIETHPRHIASFPVAVNIQCHAARQKDIII